MPFQSFTQSARSDRERGAALVEMALVTPLLILLLFGIWSVARAYNVKNTMDHAVREAARYGATLETWDANAVNAVIDAELSASSISPSVVPVADRCVELVAEAANGCGVTNAPFDQVAISIEYPTYELSFIFFSLDVDLSSFATARYEE